MRIERRYTKEGQSAYADIAFRLTTSEIRNPDGSVVFHADGVGLTQVLAGIEAAQAKGGPAPAPLLARLAAEGKTFGKS